MKNKLKYLILTFMVVLLTGCSGNYNLKINADLSVKENLELSIDNKNDAYNKTLKIFEDNKIERKKYSVNINSDKVVIKYNDEFDSIEDYILNSKVYSQLFSDIKYNKTKNYIDLSVNENLKIKDKNLINNGNNLTDFDIIQVNIENPYKVIYSNEDIKNDNIYTWSIKKDKKNQIIKMKFKTSFNKFPYRPLIVGSILLIISSIFIFKVLKKYMNFQRI